MVQGKRGVTLLALGQCLDYSVSAKARIDCPLLQAAGDTCDAPAAIPQLLGIQQLHSAGSSYGLRQEHSTPHCREQKGMIERVIRTLKEQFVYRPRFEILQLAGGVIGDWFTFYNHLRPHQALGMRIPTTNFTLVA